MREYMKKGFVSQEDRIEDMGQGVDAFRLRTYRRADDSRYKAPLGNRPLMGDPPSFCRQTRRGRLRAALHVFLLFPMIGSVPQFPRGSFTHFFAPAATESSMNFFRSGHFADNLPFGMRSLPLNAG